jgi:hypothetical protein
LGDSADVVFVIYKELNVGNFAFPLLLCLHAAVLNIGCALESLEELFIKQVA